MKKLLATLFLPLAIVLGLSGCGAGFADQAHGVKTDAAPDARMTPSEVYKAQWKIIHLEAQDYPRAADTDIMWQPCDEENSAYDPDENKIHLCTEMSEHPSAAIMFAAHEMGHSITGHYFSTYSEQEADEIGMLEMLRHGLIDDLMNAGLYYQAQDVQEHYPGDPHPPNSMRAYEAMCLAKGWDEVNTPHLTAYHGEPSTCAKMYTGLVERYEMMFANAKEATADEEFELVLNRLTKLIPKE